MKKNGKSFGKRIKVLSSAERSQSSIKNDWAPLHHHKNYPGRLDWASKILETRALSNNELLIMICCQKSTNSSWRNQTPWLKPNEKNTNKKHTSLGNKNHQNPSKNMTFQKGIKNTCSAPPQSKLRRGPSGLYIYSKGAAAK